MNENYKIIDLDRVYSYTENGKEREINGIEYVMFLRRSNYSLPILFESYDSLEKILEKKNARIVQAIGHGFLQKPYSDAQQADALEAINTLNDIQLADIKHNFSGVKSALTEGYHIFKNNLRSILEQNKDAKEEQLKKAYAHINELMNQFKQELYINYPSNTSLHKEFDRIGKLFNQSNINSAEQILNLHDDSLANTIPSEGETQAVVANDYPWEVLLLDDMQEEMAGLKKALTKQGIKYHEATTVAQAKEIINNDKSNRITVAVSDYRLFELSDDGELTKKMQPEQGYDFLVWLATQERFTAKVALSGLSTKFLMETFRRYSANVKVYSKSSLNGGGTFITEEIEQLGNEQFQALINRPKLDSWHTSKLVKDKVVSQSLKSYYVYHRNHKDYTATEIQINSDAEKVAREVEYALSKSSDFKLESLVSISGNCMKTLSSNFEEGYETFKLKLTQRRVAYFLLLKGFKQYYVYSLLQTGAINPNLGNTQLSDKIKVKATKTKKAVFCTLNEIAENNLKAVGNMLSISATADLPFGLLIEEKNFLQNHLNIPLNEIGILMDQSFVFFNDLLSVQFQKYGKELVDAIGKNSLKQNYCVLKEGRWYCSTVSIKECHIVVSKVFNFLNKKKSVKDAENFKNTSLDLMYKISQLVPFQLNNIPDLFLKLQKALKENKALTNDTLKKIIENHTTKITDDGIEKLLKL